MGKWLPNGDYDVGDREHDYIPKMNERVTVYYGGGHWENLTVIGRFDGKWVLRRDNSIEVEIKARVEKYNSYYDKNTP